jgi:hypothetical protein
MGFEIDRVERVERVDFFFSRVEHKDFDWKVPRISVHISQNVEEDRPCFIGDD